MDGIDVYAIPGFREPVSCLTHLLAAPVFAVLGWFLVARGKGDSVRIASLAILWIASVFMLSMSGTYHLLDPGMGKYVMRQIDVASVFVLIAATVTAGHAVIFRGLFRWTPIVLVWGAAALGITLRTVFPDNPPAGFRLAIFLLMGWGSLPSCIILWRRYGFALIEPLLWGGIAYTVGAVVMALRWPVAIPGVVGAHELWHLAVLVGLGLHWKFVYRFAAGPPDGATNRGECEMQIAV